jgi:Mimiviridae putative ATP-dependent RNA helicase
MITTNKLKPWQIKPANHLLDVLQKYDSALDGSDTGVGKTYIAVAIAQAIQLPTLAVVPKISVTGWTTVCEHIGENISIINYESLRTGRSGYGTWHNQEQIDDPTGGRTFVFVCLNCQRRFKESDVIEPCYTHPEGIHCFDRKARPIVYGDFTFASPAIRFIIFDEVHRCGGLDSLNSEFLIAAKRQRIRHLMLSATPAQNILQLKALGYSLDLHCLDIRGLVESNKRGAKQKVFQGWAASYGVKRDKAFHGLVWRVSAAKQRETMAAIRAQIIPARGIRITTDQVPGFPEVDIQAELIDTENEELINALYLQMESALSELRGNKESDIDPDHPLTKILRERQEVELCKIPSFVEIARSRMEQGFSIGLFVNFRKSLEELAERLRCPFIDGTVTGKQRDEIIAGYQANDTRCLAMNSDASGISIGLADLDGNFPRFGLVSPPWSATTFKQLVGRFPRDGGKSKSHFRVLFAAGTVEMKMYRALKGKLDNLDALTDGDLQPQNLRFK